MTFVAQKLKHMSTNPYEAPRSGIDQRVSDYGIDYSSDQPEILASRLNRFAAMIIDSILIMVIAFPIQIVIELALRPSLEASGTLGLLLLGAASSVVTYAVELLLYGYFLLDRGQSIGKMVLKIQIVDLNTNKLIPFMRVFVIRSAWAWPFVILTYLLPVIGGLLIMAISIIDALAIFGPNKRCFHDYLAGSKVVLFKPHRQRL